MTQLLKTAIQKALLLSESSQNDLALAILVHIKKRKKQVRSIGFATGKGHVSDDFNDPLPDEELILWHEGDLNDILNRNE